MVSIAIDGPAGAGKSTVAKMVAEKLNYLYIDTGAMYRALTLKALDSGISIEDESTVTELAEKTDITLKTGEILRVYVDNIEVTLEIRTPRVSKGVSFVASYEGVRKKLVKCQREIAKQQSVVMDGRDIGTHVLPDAEFKFFLDATTIQRAQRRYDELLSKGFEIDKEELLADLINRDYQDSSRKVSPLEVASDAIVIDTTYLTAKEVVEKIIEIINERGK